MPTPDKRIEHARKLCAGLPGIDHVQCFAYAAKHRPAIGLTDDEIKAVEPVAKKYETVHAGLMEFVSETPRAALKRQRQGLIDLASAGDSEAMKKLREVDAWDLTDFEEEARLKRMSYKTVLRNISAEARDLLKPVLSRRVAALLDWIDELELKERALAAEVGVHYIASGPLRAIAWLCTATVNLESDGIGQNPRTLLKLLGHVTPQERRAAEESRKAKARAADNARAQAAADELIRLAKLNKDQAEQDAKADAVRKASREIEDRIEAQDLEREAARKGGKE